MLSIPIEDGKVEPEVRDSIGLGNRTEDDVDIVEDLKGWCFPKCFTVYNCMEGKYLQVWKIIEV